MKQSLESIENHFDEMEKKEPNFSGMKQLVKSIRSSEYANAFNYWTSMHDLCVTQTEGRFGLDEPVLRISQNFNGSINFRYVDTYKKKDQWSRTAVNSQAYERFLSFVEQLHWVVKYERGKNP